LTYGFSAENGERFFCGQQVGSNERGHPSYQTLCNKRRDAKQKEPKLLVKPAEEGGVAGIVADGIEERVHANECVARARESATASPGKTKP
jgi:hypothetical protein